MNTYNRKETASKIRQLAKMTKQDKYGKLISLVAIFVKNGKLSVWGILNEGEGEIK